MPRAKDKVTFTPLQKHSSLLSSCCACRQEQPSADHFTSDLQTQKEATCDTRLRAVSLPSTALTESKKPFFGGGVSCLWRGRGGDESERNFFSAARAPSQCLRNPLTLSIISSASQKVLLLFQNESDVPEPFPVRTGYVSGTSTKQRALQR